MPFPGVRSAMKAIAGGPVTEQDAYNLEQRRLTAARSAMALMDKRVSDANMAGRTDKAGGQLQDMLDMTDPNNVAIIAKLASEMNAAQTARGTKQEVDFQGELMDKFRTDSSSVTPEMSNMFQAIAGRGAMMSGPNVAPTVDSRLEQEKVRAQTDASTALSEQRRKTGTNGEPLYQKVTDSRFEQYVFPEEIGGYAHWKRTNLKDDPTLNDEQYAIEKFRDLVNSGLLDGEKGTPTGLMSGVMDGSTPETAIPAETLSAPPAPGTWVIVNGVKQRYKGQK
jgi:hypothetical protein